MMCGTLGIMRSRGAGTNDRTDVRIGSSLGLSSRRGGRAFTDSRRRGSGLGMCRHRADSEGRSQEKTGRGGHLQALLDCPMRESTRSAIRQPDISIETGRHRLPACPRGRGLRVVQSTHVLDPFRRDSPIAHTAHGRQRSAEGHRAASSRTRARWPTTALHRAELVRGPVLAPVPPRRGAGLPSGTAAAVAGQQAACTFIAAAPSRLIPSDFMQEGLRTQRHLLRHAPNESDCPRQ